MSDPTTIALVSNLVARHGGAAALARVLGGKMTARSVLRHANGERKPNAETLAKYVALAAQSVVVAAPIPVAESSASETPKPAPIVDAVKSDFDREAPTLDAVIELAASADEALAQVLSDPNASHRDRAISIHAYARALRDLATMRGELAPSEATIVRSPAWMRLLGIVTDAVRPFPDAARAIADALATLEKEPP
jgi:hypothetical protein